MPVPLSTVTPAQGYVSQAGSPSSHPAPLCSKPGPGAGAVPGQEGREPGRAGRGAPAGRGSGASCSAQRGLLQPMVGRATGAGSAQHQCGLGMRMGWFPCVSRCHLWMFTAGLYPAGIVPFPPLPQPWESGPVPAFNIPPSLPVTYCSQSIPCALACAIPKGLGGTRRFLSAMQDRQDSASPPQGLQPGPYGCRHCL